MDWTLVTFSITGLLFVWALYGMRLVDLVPIARDKVVVGMRDGMIVLDMQDRIIDINQVAAKMLDLSTDLLIGNNMLDLIPTALLLKEQPVEIDVRTEFELGDIDKRYFDVLISPLFEDRTRVVGRLVVFRDITDRNQTQLKLEEQNLKLQALHKDLQESQTKLVGQERELASVKERQRLARDLHDSVSQSINGMVLFADTLSAMLEKNNINRAKQIMGRLRRSANQSLRETRLLLYELQGSGPERSVDLIRGLKERLAMVEGRAGVRTQFIHEGAMENYPPEWEKELFWIAIEALNNVLKHAEARSVQIIIRCLPDRLEMEIIDDGKGFDSDHIDAGGLGLKNLYERADIIGGKLHIHLEPSKGTTVGFTAEIKAE